MRKHILRAPQTDRYSLSVPTALSELTDDLPTNPYLAGASGVQVSGAAPVYATFQVDASTYTGAAGGTVALGTTFSQNRGFTVPTTGDLVITIPETGLYIITVNVSWFGTGDTGGGIGRIETPYDVTMAAGLGDYGGTFAGTLIMANKLEPIYNSVTSAALTLRDTAIAALTAGDTLTAVANITVDTTPLPGPGVIANISFSLVRIA